MLTFFIVVTQHRWTWMTMDELMIWWTIWCCFDDWCGWKIDELLCEWDFEFSCVLYEWFRSLIDGYCWCVMLFEIVRNCSCKIDVDDDRWRMPKRINDGKCNCIFVVCGILHHCLIWGWLDWDGNVGIFFIFASTCYFICTVEKFSLWWFFVKSLSCVDLIVLNFFSVHPKMRPNLNDLSLSSQSQLCTSLHVSWWINFLWMIVNSLVVFECNGIWNSLSRLAMFLRWASII